MRIHRIFQDSEVAIQEKGESDVEMSSFNQLRDAIRQIRCLCHGGGDNKSIKIILKYYYSHPSLEHHLSLQLKPLQPCPKAEN
ncbi:hypothetical protein AMECASPLE_007094 [Ameca splendens]|uniref:Uncharacterized protein n=1 Tax=Ameca splendens TaxID=208324 RepID=A0ABV0YMD8_9TELE